MSVTALVGTNSQLHCAGTGNYLVWEVDGLQTNHPDILARGITVVTLPSSGTVQSNLTVPATSVNNGTTVRCAISVSLFSTPAISNYSTLTVLPGKPADDYYMYHHQPWLCSKFKDQITFIAIDFCNMLQVLGVFLT